MIKIFPRMSLICSLILTLLFPAHAFSAAEVVKSIEFDQNSPIHLYVEHNTQQLKVLATIEGSTAKKDVTDQVYWASTNPAIVKVDKGLLTPLGRGTVKITAKYSGYTITMDVTSDYLFKELTLDAEETLHLQVGDTNVQLHAQATDNNDDSYDVSDIAVWNSSNTNVATVSKGKLTLVGQGATTITARHKGLSDSVKVEVTSPYTALAIEPGTGLDFIIGDENQQLEAYATLPSLQKEEVTDQATWHSSDQRVVKVDDGELEFTGAGTATITASYLGVSTSVQVIVRLPYQALILTPSQDMEFFVGDDPLQMKAQVADEHASRLDVTSSAVWTSADPYIATVQAGLVSPQSPGSTAIKVSYLGLEKTFYVTVFPTITDIEIDEDRLVLFKGEVADLPVVVGTNLDEQDLDFSPIATWETSNADIVKIENGKIVAGRPGTAQIISRIRGHSDYITVTVREKVLALFPSEQSYSLVVDDIEKLPRVTALFEDGTEQDVTNEITWTASEPNLLLQEGQMRALLGAKVTLQGTFLNKTITIPVSIEEELTDLTADPQTIVLNIGRSKSIKVTGLYRDGNEVSLASKITWTSSNTDIATVKGSSVKAVSKGEAYITGKYQGKPITIKVQVVPKIKKMETETTRHTLSIGEQRSLKLSVLYDTGEVEDVTSRAIWTSSNLSIVTVDGGQITALKKGQAYVKGIYENKTVTFRIKVN